jgi:hypothetical protein
MRRSSNLSRSATPSKISRTQLDNDPESFSDGSDSGDSNRMEGDSPGQDNELSHMFDDTPLGGNGDKKSGRTHKVCQSLRVALIIS